MIARSRTSACDQRADAFLVPSTSPPTPRLAEQDLSKLEEKRVELLAVEQRRRELDTTPRRGRRRLKVGRTILYPLSLGRRTSSNGFLSLYTAPPLTLLLSQPFRPALALSLFTNSPRRPTRSTRPSSLCAKRTVSYSSALLSYQADALPFLSFPVHRAQYSCSVVSGSPVEGSGIEGFSSC